jgi:hypothetical protein
MKQFVLMEHNFAESMTVLLRDGIGQGLENRQRHLSVTAIGFYRSKKGYHTGYLCYESPRLQIVLRYTEEAMQMYPLDKPFNTGKS